MDFEKVMAELFRDEDSARSMAHRLMDLAQRDPRAAAQEKDSLLAFLRGPMEKHMQFEEQLLFPGLLEHGLGPEVEVASKHHVSLRQGADTLAAATEPAAVARAVFLAARLMLHHTNFEGDYIYPELTRKQWHALLEATVGLKK